MKTVATTSLPALRSVETDTSSLLGSSTRSICDRDVFSFLARAALVMYCWSIVVLSCQAMGAEPGQGLEGPPAGRSQTVGAFGFVQCSPRSTTIAGEESGPLAPCSACPASER
jgi:hypothetical protein